MGWTDAQKKYANSPKGKIARQKYQSSEKAKEAHRLYMLRRKAKLAELKQVKEIEPVKKQEEAIKIETGAVKK
ncbi:MAG: hypothetical protein WCT85_00850 [Parachlamydiales bacterium]|jgi:hypothetical protein